MFTTRPTLVACVLTVCILSVGCSGPTSTEPKIGNPLKCNVERVFMHTPGVYSVMVKEGEFLKAYYPADLWQSRGNIRGNTNTEIVADVPPDAPMWLEMWKEKDYSFGSPSETRTIIHIHNPDDVGGGGWRSGKGGRYHHQTEVIE
jgi:hypothetical protein